jgi:nitrogen PTS system EIIA component
MVSLAPLLRPDLVFVGLPLRPWRETLETFADQFERTGLVPSTASLAERLLAREAQGSTVVRPGVVLPHCKVPGLARSLVAVGTFPPSGSAHLGRPEAELRAIFAVVSPERAPTTHLQALAAVSRWLKSDERVEALLAAPDAAALFRLLSQD